MLNTLTEIQVANIGVVHYLSGYMEKVFGFVHVPDLHHCPSPCFRKLVSAILRSLYTHLAKNASDLYAARDVTL